MIAPSGAVSVIQGNDQVFTIIPLSGYRIAEVLVDGSLAGTVSSYTFNDVAANHTIQASFEEIPAGTIAYVGEVGTAFANESGTSLKYLLVQPVLRLEIPSSLALAHAGPAPTMSPL